MQIADQNLIEQLDDVSSLRAIAEAYCQAGWPEFSVPAYAKCLDLTPLDFELRMAVIDVLLSLKEWGLASHLIQSAVWPDIHEPALVILQSRCEAQLGDCKLAEARLLDLQGVNKVNYFQLGVALTEVNIKSGNEKRANDCLTRLDQLAPATEQCALLRLDLLSSQWAGNQIDSVLPKLLADFVNQRRVLIRIGEVYKRYNSFNEAYAVYQTAIASFGCDGILAERFLELLVDMVKLEELRAVIRKEPSIIPPRELRLLEVECLINCDSDQEAELILAELPQSQVALHLFAEIAKRKGDCKAALDCRRQLFESDRVSPECQFEYAEALLSLGCWDVAWPLYEARFLRQRNSEITPAGINPRNSIASPFGKHVLAFGEQGLGDTVMMASMLPDLINDCASCSVFVHPRLEQWFAEAFPAASVFSRVNEDVFEAMDSCYGIGSLGQFYRNDAKQFPGTPYLQVRNQSLLNSWRERLESLGSGLKIGVAWRGGRGVSAKRRSLDLVNLLPLAEVDPNVVWVNLQYSHSGSQNELEDIQSTNGWVIHQFDGIARDMYQTAALTQALDLVITVQQTALHVAGAVGTKAFVLLPLGPEWRYGASGSGMPWYGSVELFRQEQVGDWQKPISSIKHRLAALTAGGESQNGVC